jgi:hypothetical protein
MTPPVEHRRRRGRADNWFAPNTLAGFSLAGGGTNFLVANNGSGRGDLLQVGASCTIRPDQLISQRRRPMAGRISLPIVSSAAIGCAHSIT